MTTEADRRRAIAQRHVETGRLIIKRQKVFIELLKARGADTRDSEDLLRTFERTQVIFEDEWAAILDDANPPKTGMGFGK